MSFFIYTIHNLLNNKIYVGKSINCKERWKKHKSTAFGSKKNKCYPVHRALKRYGIYNFEFSTIQELSSEKELNDAEKYWIKFFNSKNSKFGYNLTDGGEGCLGNIHSKETRLKMSKSATGRKLSEEVVLGMSGENSVLSKLKYNEVQDIRYKYNVLKQKLVDISKEYIVSSRTIARVIYNIDWHDNNYIPPVPRKTSGIGIPKLTKEKVEQIRQLSNDGEKIPKLAELFGVTDNNIGIIIRNETWKIDEAEYKNMFPNIITDKADINYRKRNFNKHKKHIMKQKIGYSKLLNSQVLEIREKYKSGNYSYTILAKEYSVDRKLIAKIINDGNKEIK